MPTPLMLNNKTLQWVIVHTKYRTTRVGQKHFVCSILLIGTFIFDRKAEQY